MAHDTLGYDRHVVAYHAWRYMQLEPKGYLYGHHDHCAVWHFRRHHPCIRYSAIG